MMLFTTEINAINPVNSELTKFVGPNIEAISFNEAHKYCQNNCLGYCKVTGILVAEISDKVINHDFNQN